MVVIGNLSELLRIGKENNLELKARVVIGNLSELLRIGKENNLELKARELLRIGKENNLELKARTQGQNSRPDWDSQQSAGCIQRSASDYRFRQQNRVTDSVSDFSVQITDSDYRIGFPSLLRQSAFSFRHSATDYRIGFRSLLQQSAFGLQNSEAESRRQSAVG